MYPEKALSQGIENLQNEIQIPKKSFRFHVGLGGIVEVIMTDLYCVVI